MPATDASEDRTDALRQYAALLHGKPRLDGVSGFVTPSYRRFRRVLQSFPADSSLAAAGSFGARWIVVHYGDFPMPARAGLEHSVASSGHLRMMAREGTDALYRLEP